MKNKILIALVFFYFFQFAIAYCLDYLFLKSKIYKSAVIFSSTDLLKEKDIIIMGGSNGLVSYETSLLENNIKKKVYNLSEDDTNIQIHLLQLKLLLKKEITPETIILNIGSLGSNLSRNVLRYLPILGKNHDFDMLFQKHQTFNYYMYRIFSILKWGMYNNDLLYPLAFNIIKSNRYKHRFNEDGEYTYPNLKSSILSDDYEFIELNNENETLNEFKILCLENNINLIIVNTPYYKKKIKWNNSDNKVKNYSTLYANKPEYFYDNLHLNKIGKKEYTKQFIYENFSLNK